jgi:hypothetical protein
MNRWILRTLLVALGATLLIPTPHAQDNHGARFVCSNRTLKGEYAFRVTGEVFAGPVPPAVITIYRDGIAMTTFDGNGGLWQEDYVLGNGNFVADPDNSDTANGFNTHETGNYQVFPNCTGQAEIDFPSAANPKSPVPHQVFLNFVIAKHGEILHTIVSKLVLLNSDGSTSTPFVNVHSDAERVN